MIKILFVDDERDVLDGIKRMMNLKKDEWELRFTTDPAEAIGLFGEGFDVVVVDLLMPKIDGIQLLKILAREYPETIRIVLTGFDDENLILQTVKTAHQLIAKPTTRTELISRIEKSLRLKKLFTNKELAKLVTSSASLPTLPENYHRMQKELEKEFPSLKKISEIIEEDPSMAAEVLRLVNSAFFNMPKEITSIQEAVNILGINVIKSVALYVEIFSYAKKLKSNIVKQIDLWKHSVRVGVWSKILFSIVFPNKITSDSAYISGLLHDVGYLIISNMEKYDEKISAEMKKGAQLFEAEKNIYNVSHAEVGAYLLSVWNLPEPVIRAVANHHEPGSVFPMDKLSKVIYLANLYEHKKKFTEFAGKYLTTEEIKLFEEKLKSENIPAL